MIFQLQSVAMIGPDLAGIYIFYRKQNVIPVGMIGYIQLDFIVILQVFPSRSKDPDYINGGTI